MRTLLALVAATAMILVALYVRGGGPGGDGGLVPDLNREPVAMVCIPELEAVCREVAGEDVQVTVEEAGVTADRLAGTDVVEYDAWLTLAPWPQIAAEARTRELGRDLPPAADDPLARSPLVMVVRAARAPVLDAECGGTSSWRCIGRVAGNPWARIGGEEAWGDVKPGFTDPSVSGSGLLVVGQAAGDFLGPDEFSVRGMDSDGFLGWSSQLERAVPQHGTPQNTPLAQQVRLAASFDVVGTTEAEAGPLLASSARAQGLELRYPEPLVVAEVVLAPLTAGDGADRLRELLAESGDTLAAAGWRVEGVPPVAGVSGDVELPPESNLPSAGVLDALRARWGEI